MKLKAMFLLTLIVLVALAACAPAPTPAPTAAPPTAAVPPTQPPAPTAAPTVASSSSSVASSSVASSSSSVASSSSSASSSAASSAAPTATKPAATNTPAPTPTPPVPQVTAAPGALKVQFWHVFSTTQGVAMQKLIDKFNAANPQYYIVGTYQGSYTPISQKMTASITANSLPDIVWGYPGDIANYYNAGVVVPFDSYISDPKDGLTADQLADINTSVYFSKYDGKTIAISAAGSEQVMFYNADMLKAAGFTQPPATWADFDKVCAAVSKPPDTYCYAFIPSASTVAEWFWSWGSDYASADEKKAAFNNPNGVAMLQWLKNQADKKWSYQPSGSFGDQTDFGNGKVAFTFSSTAGLPFYATAVSGSKAPFNWNIAPVPAGPNGKQIVDVFQPSMAILKSTPEKQRAAWLWVKFMLSKDAGTDWALATTYYPPSKSTLDSLLSMDAATAKAANPGFATVLDQYKLGTKFAASYGRVEPASPAWQGVRSIVENMVTAVFTGKSGADFKATDPEGALKEAEQRVNDALSQYGK